MSDIGIDACGCVKAVNIHLAESNTVLSEATMANWKTNKYRQALIIQTEKLRSSKQRKRTVTASFCPFCGVRTAPIKEGEAP